MQTKSPFKSAYVSPRVLVVLLVCAAACLIATRTLPAFLRSEAPATVSQRTLSFAERVAYQRAMEDVYWRHRIWPRNRGERPDSKPPLDAVMSQAQLEKKVADYLRKSQALADYWQRPITAEQLQAEVDRMATHTRQPEVLRQLFEALGNDPFVIAECLARPVLSEQLVTSSYGYGQRFHGTARPLLAAASASYTLPMISDGPNGCIDDTWTATSTANAPSARDLHTAVWTGTEMIVWGGIIDPINYTNTGGKYNPSTDSWTAINTTNAPTGRYAHTAIWTGSEMIVWVGRGTDYFNTGGRYNPSTDSWIATSTTNAPTGRVDHTAVWTGGEMIVWGGSAAFPTFFNTGGKYNPSTDSWAVPSTTNAPTARDSHTAVWAGNEMIVWGGYDGTNLLNTGGRYDSGADSWAATSITNAPAARHWHTAVGTGSEMIVWGGTDDLSPFNTGGRYDPGADAWTATSTTSAPDARFSHAAVWIGSEMIVWGGVDSNGNRSNTGGRYCAQSGPSPTPTPTPTPSPTPTPCTGRCTPTPRPRPTPAPRP